MSFNTHTFIFLILPLTTVLGLLIRRSFQKAYLLYLGLLSLILYSIMDYSQFGILMGSILINFFFIKKRTPLILSVSTNLSILLVFKYLKIGLGTSPYIPLGISFFILQQISSLVDSHKPPKNNKDLSIIEYASFVSMYPQLIAGPIIRLDYFLEQVREKKIFKEIDFRTAFLFICMGLFKKVVIADSISAFIYPELDQWMAGEIPPHAGVYCLSTLYGFMVYFDFSGYSEMAVGIAHLMGFKLPQNFNSPFKQTTIIGLWRNWHITIHDFMVDYFFKPFSKYSPPIVALFFTFFFISVWHGSTINFIFFGLYMAILVTLYRILNFKWPKYIGLPLTTLLFGSSGPFFFGRQSASRVLQSFLEQFSTVSLDTFQRSEFFWVFFFSC
ncbi:MAG: hypothetical protein NXH75_14980, partial [Halobacteriovoraceae bacterium]|nr:hypothetical protein [Halobacteriovoraceae bacterium]